MTDHPTYLCDACRIPLCDADDCRDPLHSGAHHVGTEVYCRDCGEVPELKAEVATLRAQVTEAADAARRAERDRCADLVSGWHISKGGYTELAHVLRQDPK